MGAYVQSTDIGSAWLAAFAAIDASHGEVVNLVVDIQEPLKEDVGVRSAIEHTLSSLKQRRPKEFGNVQSMHTVANTIFPISLYRPGIEGAGERFMQSALAGLEGRQHAKKRQWGTYLGRLLAYPSAKGEQTKQIELILDRLSGSQADWSDLYEVPILAPGHESNVPWEDSSGAATSSVGAVLHRDVRADSRWRGGPCLALISLTLCGGELSMLALYRRHSYVARAYGNFLGLARLLSFLATESGNRVGNLMVTTGHAVAEAPGRTELLTTAQAGATGASNIELGARPPGASWADLELKEAS